MEWPLSSIKERRHLKPYTKFVLLLFDDFRFFFENVCNLLKCDVLAFTYFPKNLTSVLFIPRLGCRILMNYPKLVIG